MQLSKVYEAANRTPISFELFPPKTSKGEQNLYRHVERLMKYCPDYITCTYGAGGSTRDKTLEIVQQVKSRFEVPVASHLTVVGSTVDELRGYLREAVERGVDYVVALRGDPPEGQATFSKTEGGLGYANELVELIDGEFANLGIIVAGYPEKHREAPTMEVDLANLKRKVDSGADVIITQLFYDNSDFFQFRDQCRKQGIEIPIVPGLLPVTNLGQVQRITSLCGSKLPGSFEAALRASEDPEHQSKVGIEHAIRQTEELQREGVDGFHFYILNKSDATIQILDAVFGEPATSTA